MKSWDIQTKIRTAHLFLKNDNNKILSCQKSNIDHKSFRNISINFSGSLILVILLFQFKGIRYLESIIAGLTGVILSCFTYEIIVSNPDVFPIIAALVPTPQIVFNPENVYTFQSEFS